ncbi:hypothetical protein QAZ01_06065 [Glaesserella parasuis]|uniref:hypothetical protein n=1 Tax=Glaesserella parasuis TaxID=738 RepID=UPI0024369E9F|nr:hypothetical protein [Glaesserella parasuis]MDG6450512.1 hypothetical protein [Glaesserella parasuis]MDO9791513.1 hypothetical protein [Glaesserella parasuis]
MQENNSISLKSAEFSCSVVMDGVNENELRHFFMLEGYQFDYRDDITMTFKKVVHFDYGKSKKEVADYLTAQLQKALEKKNLSLKVSCSLKVRPEAIYLEPVFEIPTSWHYLNF